MMPERQPAAMAAAGDRPLRVLMLPPMAWGPGRRAHVPGEAPDPFALDAALLGHGIGTVLVDPHRRPLNPFAGGNTLLESFDPWRAIGVLLRERRADLVVCVFEGPALPLLLLRRLARFRVPVALWDIGLTETWALRERVLDLVVPRVDAIMVLGTNQVDYIRRRWPKAPPVTMVGHHVDAAFYAMAPPRHAGPVLSVGEDVGRDFAALRQVAEGLGEAVVVKTRRQRATMAGALPANMQLVDRWLSFRELRGLYEAARVVVVPLLPTLNAGGVSTILEAMAMGRPLVVSDAPGIRDYIIPGETCLAVPCGDGAGLRAAVDRLLAEPEMAARLAANGRRLVEQRFTDAAFAAGLAPVLRRIAAAGMRGSGADSGN